MNIDNSDFEIEVLGECAVKSPLSLSTKNSDNIANFTKNGQRAILNARVQREDLDGFNPILLEIAGPREKIYFEPEKVRAAIVTCGGLCPGLNNVVRGIVRVLKNEYGVKTVLGIRNGYMGLLPEFGFDPIELTVEMVDKIHHNGGTILGSSRGNGERTVEMVQSLKEQGVNMLFTIGGDGTQKGALNINNEAKKIGFEISVVGIPKTIDNDLSYVRKSFGFETAVATAVEAVKAAAVEAKSAPNGIGLVKLMGRESGFIAAQTALASGEVDFVLIPEIPVVLNGVNGFLTSLKIVVKNRGCAVVVVAEGAGQELLENYAKKYQDVDASGNQKLGDIGIFLRDKIIEFFKLQNIDSSLKYIDPSYIIRSQPANSNDSIYCSRLAGGAVHSAMAGKTSLLVGLVHSYFVHIPIKKAVSKRNVINPDSEFWQSVIEATGQQQSHLDVKM